MTALPSLGTMLQSPRLASVSILDQLRLSPYPQLTQVPGQPTQPSTPATRPAMTAQLVAPSRPVRSSMTMTASLQEESHFPTGLPSHLREIQHRPSRLILPMAPTTALTPCSPPLQRITGLITLTPLSRSLSLAHSPHTQSLPHLQRASSICHISCTMAH